MISAVMELLTSGSKWGKLLLLLREQVMMSRSWLGQPAGLKVASQNSDGDARVEDKPVRVCHHEWTYTSSLQMPGDLLDGAGTRFKQDRLAAGGTLQTVYSYQSAVYEDACIYSNGTSHVSVFDRHGRRVPEFSYRKYTRGIPDTCRIMPGKYLDGTTLSLYGNVENASGNIGHWMIDGISRVFLAQRHHELADIDHVLVPRLRYGFQKDSLVNLGLPEEKIVEIDALECVCCEHLLVTTAPRGFSSSGTPGWLVEGFRNAMLPPRTAVGRGKRLYISRRDAGSRKFINEEDIIACLETYGFTAVEMSDFDFNEKIALFAEAEVIVGLTGAGLTNLMFCQPHAHILELFPASYVTYFYTSMCAYLGLDYRYIVFDNDSALSSMNRYYGNLYLDVDVLEAKVRSLLSDQSQ